MEHQPTGPLEGLRVLEFAGMGPAPFAAMLLGDMGADVLRIERPKTDSAPANLISRRSRRCVPLDLKDDEGLEAALELAARADVLVEGFRPGVMERLGLGPDECHSRNPRLTYARVTGWGRDGPLAPMAGHDINYLALSGALHAIGPRGGAPVIPLNLVGDFGGGALYLAYGIVCAILQTRQDGRGRVVDATMYEGAMSLMAMFFDHWRSGLMTAERGANLLDGGLPYYAVYECADGGHVAVGALELPLRRALLEGLGLDVEPWLEPADANQREALRGLLARSFARLPRDEWARRFAGTEACVTPVLSLGEAMTHPHVRARGFIAGGPEAPQPGLAPRVGEWRGRFESAGPLQPAEAVARWTHPAATTR
jgi:alpha-methylacyl-CoA racemase